GALKIELRGVQLRLVLLLGGLRLLERVLERARIDLKQRVAGLHLLAFAEEHLGDLAIDPRLDGHGVERLHAAEPFDIDRHVAGVGGPAEAGTGGRRWGADPQPAERPRLPRNQGADDQQPKSDDNGSLEAHPRPATGPPANRSNGAARAPLTLIRPTLI